MITRKRRKLINLLHDYGAHFLLLVSILLAFLITCCLFIGETFLDARENMSLLKYLPAFASQIISCYFLHQTMVVPPGVISLRTENFDESSFDSCDYCQRCGFARVPEWRAGHCYVLNR